MADKMIKCKHCGEEIAKSAKTCPKCGGKNKKPFYKKLWFWLIVIVIIGIAGSSSGGKKSDSGKVKVTAEKDKKDKDNNKKSDKKDDSEDTGSDDDVDDADDADDADDDGFAYEITDTNFEYYTNSIGNIEYYGYVEITNTGSTNIYMDECTFDIEDNDGHLLQSDDYISKTVDILAPGEVGYFFNSLGSSNFDDDVDLSNGVKLVPNYKLEEANDDVVDYVVSDTDIKENKYGGVKVTGRVENTTDEDDSLVQVSIIFYDKNDKVIGIDFTYIDELDAGSKQSFDTSTRFASESIKFKDIKDYKVIARKSYYQF